MRRVAPLLAAALLVIVAFLPIVIPMFDAQPQDMTVAGIQANAVEEPTGWVRLRGKLVRLETSPTGAPGRYSLLVDAADQLDAIVLRTEGTVRAAESTMITGHLEFATVTVEDDDIPLQGTIYGAPPAVLEDRIIELDPVPKPVRVTWWPLAIPPLLLAAGLVVGAGRPYPLFHPTTEIDVLSTPLAPGERLAGVWGGRLGPNQRDLADPGAVLFVVRPDEKGNLLTAQPLPDSGGPAPAAVPIGGDGSSGRIGEVHTIRETVPALRVRAGDVEATFLFPKRGERDRIAALLAAEYD